MLYVAELELKKARERSYDAAPVARRRRGGVRLRRLFTHRERRGVATTHPDVAAL
jgi:hypothetical protein